MPILMSIDGIRGNGTIAEYEGWLMLEDFNWGGSRGAQQNRPTDRRSLSALAVAPQLRAVKAVRMSDQATPEIWNLMLGMTRKKVEFVWLRTGADGTVPYMKLLLDNALITAMGEAADSTEPVESISFSYEKITLTVLNVGNRLSGPQDIVTYDLPQALRA